MRTHYEEPTPRHDHNFVNGLCVGCGAEWRAIMSPPASLAPNVSSSASSSSLDTNLLLLSILETLVSVNAQLVQLNSSAASSNNIATRGFSTMAAQLDAINQEIRDATTAISARIQALLDQITADGQNTITPEQQASLQAEADALKAIGTPPVVTSAPTRP